MSEKDGVAFSEAPEDDDLLDVLDSDDVDLEEEDLEDEALDLEDGIIVQQFVPDEIDVGDTNGPELDEDEDFDLAPDSDADLDVGFEPDLDEAEDADDDLLLAAAVAPATGDVEERLARVEAAARALAQAELDRERGRVRRKVTAATTGAGAVGFIPILLQLAGAFNLDAELAAAVSTGAAILGAFGAGWATPERKQVVAETPAANDLLNDGA